jgi:hypothetical protein
MRARDQSSGLTKQDTRWRCCRKDMENRRSTLRRLDLDWEPPIREVGFVIALGAWCVSDYGER